MKIKISKINDSAFTVRERIDPEHLKEIKESMNDDGQWDAIIVRPVGDTYEVIAGHTRVQAAKELGWREIEANVRDFSDTDALFLALKTNLLRQDMSETEQGKVIQKIVQDFGITNMELAKRIGKHHSWVDQRLRLVTKLHQSVIDAINENKVSMAVATRVIASLDVATQEQFLIYLLENNIRGEVEAAAAKRRFLNKTICTIGYEGKELQEFITILKNNNIDYLLDIRFSGESTYKPDFNKSVLAREMEREHIKYEHHAELGLPYEWQNPYKAEAIKVDCVAAYYKWHVTNEMNFAALVGHVKNSGKTALMCMEKYAKPTRDQKIHCHRHILADLLLATGEFTERVDL